MSSQREHSVTEALLTLADGLVGPFDVVELLNDLTEMCARLLDVASAGLLLADNAGSLHVVAASSEATRSLEVFQVQRDEGPCLECYRTGEAVRIADLSREIDRWPQFVSAATKRGLVSVHAVPMRLENEVFGTLGLFGTSTGMLNDDDLNLGQALAHMASVAIVAGNATADRERLSNQLQSALDGRVYIEQAKGVIAQSANLSMDEAFELLRSYAQDNNLKLTQVAQAAIARGPELEQILGNRTSAR